MQRKTIGAVVALVLVVGVAVGAFAFTNLAGDGAESAIDRVPADVDVVMSVDGDIMDDQITQQVAEAAAPEGTGGEGTDVSEAFSELEAETGLDPEDFGEAVAFGQIPQGGTMAPGGEYTGFVVHSDWDTDTVLETIRENSTVELEESTYNGMTVYSPAEEPELGSATAFGVLGDGQFVGGTPEAVEDTIDVVQGDADTLGGDLRQAYDDSPDGLAEFAIQIPTEQVPDQQPAFGPDVSQFQSVNVVAGSYYTTSNAAGLEFQLLTDGGDDARDVADVVEGGLSLVSGFTQDEAIQEHVRAVDVERNGSTVLVTYEESVDSLQDLFEYLESQSTGGVGV